jgi:hypothetical protein
VLEGLEGSEGSASTFSEQSRKRQNLRIQLPLWVCVGYVRHVQVRAVARCSLVSSHCVCVFPCCVVNLNDLRGRVRVCACVLRHLLVPAVQVILVAREPEHGQ